jgi:monoamine oxidase
MYHQIWRTVDYGVAPEHLSLLQYARDDRLWQRAPDLISGRVQGGMDRLPAAMAAELGERVLLNARVTALRHDDQAVSIQFDRDGVAGRLRASYVVLAVPPAAARRLDVDPPLPAALAGMAMGRVSKLLVQVRRRFWEDHGLTGRAFTDGLLQAMYETTAGLPGERAILTVYTADRTADALAAMSDAERRAVCVRELERLYPGCSGDIERVTLVAWNQVAPRGSAIRATGPAYSHFRPGDVARFGPWLMGPVGRIHLAGEHTDQWQATMNGALASGLRAASEILARLP